MIGLGPRGRRDDDRGDGDGRDGLHRRVHLQRLPHAVRQHRHGAARGRPRAGRCYRVLFLAGLLLFALTFVLNTVAEMVRLRFRAKFKGL